MRLCAFVAVPMALAALAGAQPPKAARNVLPFKPTETTLPNGLRVIVVPTGFPNIVSIQIPVQTGSRNEVEPGRSGFAHFFEHLMFRGTPTTPPEKYQEIMVKAGARENACTGDDVTTYYATFAKEDLDQMLQVYADMFQNLAYSEADFKTESRAILGRVQQEQREPAPEAVRGAARPRVHQPTPTSTRRWASSRTSRTCPTSTRYSKVFFGRWYRPQFTTLIIAGDVDADRGDAAGAEVLGRLEAGRGRFRPGAC